MIFEQSLPLKPLQPQHLSLQMLGDDYPEMCLSTRSGTRLWPSVTKNKCHCLCYRGCWVLSTHIPLPRNESAALSQTQHSKEWRLNCCFLMLECFQLWPTDPVLQWARESLILDLQQTGFLPPLLFWCLHRACKSASYKSKDYGSGNSGNQIKGNKREIPYFCQLPSLPAHRPFIVFMLQ